MKKYIPVLLLLSSLFSVKSYAQGTTCAQDTIPPVITCPGDITLQAELGECTAEVTWTTPVVTDNCGDSTVTCSFLSGETFPVGLTTVTCTAIDSSGNVATCDFDVTVLENIPPLVLICPSDVTVSADSSMCNAAVNFNFPQVDLNCESIIVECDFPAENIFPVGITSIICNGTSSSGDTASCSFDVTVIDNEPPELICPGDIEVLAEPFTCIAAATWETPSATDNCDSTIVVCSFSSGDIFPLGTTTITCSATDLSGNTAECSFDVNVVDSTPPITLNCPAYIEVPIDTSGCGAVATWDYPLEGTHGCDGWWLACNYYAGHYFPVGITTVICIGTDAWGNTDECSFDVTVTGNCLSCPPTINLNNVTANGLYHAENSVTTTNTTTSGSDVNFKAGDVIELKNGFTAPANTNFSAEIEDCTPNFGADTGHNN